MSNYVVYRHTSPSGKVYIGMTKQSAEQRWQYGLGYRTQAKFYRAIQKYGWENIRHEVVFSNLNFEEAEQKERELIEQHQSWDNRFVVGRRIARRHGQTDAGGSDCAVQSYGTNPH